MICGTLTPTQGSIMTNGRIAALLELGSGFNPEYTGRDNVYLNGSLLGLSRDEIEQRFDDIVAFADIGDFIDQPVKTYSSGMVVRLAFSVSVNVEPQILVVDEALAVGDELFQRKCFSRIAELKAKGTTILFVSHSAGAVVELCDRALLLDAGELLWQGKPRVAVINYQKLLYAPADKRAQIREQIKQMVQSYQDMPPSADAGGSAESISVTQDPAAVSDVTAPVEYTSDSLNDCETDVELASRSSPMQESFDPHLVSNQTMEYASRGAYVKEPVIRTFDGERVNNLIRRRRYQYTYQVHFTHTVAQVRFGMVIRTISGLPLGGAMSSQQSDTIPVVVQGTTITVTFDFDCLLNPGTYFMNAGVFGRMHDEEETVLHRLVDAAVFRVMPVENNLATGMIDFGYVAKVKVHE
ncbi:Teichoic acid export ATP-binding protein TagH [Dickeya aquatica]|uniref:Teichoic acid export ATP-binding protein TagH n=2 Tax=Pectobacteriaceae TaxID=1903410 RepID=A0A375A5U8_9GAMM|nr:Teichoic acid export ATP-binding protein TagH [Dickeya aquatica]